MTEETSVSYSPDNSPRFVNWWLIGGTVVAVVVAFVLLKKK